MARKLDYVIVDLLENTARNLKANPINLGGIAGVGGGVGGPPGGFIGRLPQYQVTYDISELATLDTAPSGLTGSSGWSLVDNLNHIRYRIGVLESSGVASSGITVIDDNTSSTYNLIYTIHFVGSGVIVTDLGGGEVEVRIDATGTGSGGYTREEIEDFVGAMVTGNTETGITVTYDDTNAKLDFVTDVQEAPIDGNQYGRQNGSWTVISGIASSGIETFLELTDTPDTYVGQGGKLVAVNGGETALEFITVSSGGGTPLTVQEYDGSPVVTNVNTITFSGAIVTDLGSGEALVSINSGITASGQYRRFVLVAIVSGWSFVDCGAPAPMETLTNLE